MGPITGFITNKALQEIWILLENSFKDTVTLEQVSCVINDKLDLLKNASYKAACTYLREGNLEKFKEKIIDTISFDEFNLVAQLAYIKLLISEQKYQIAFEQYWNIMDKYGCISSVVPQLIIDEYVRNNHKNIVFPKGTVVLFPGLGDSRLKKYEVSGIWISRNIFVAEWKRPKSNWFFFSKNHFDRYIISVSNVNSCQILKFQDQNVEIIAVTNMYLVLKVDYSLKLFDANGKEVSYVSESQIESLFSESLAYNKFSVPLEVNVIGDIDFYISKIRDTEDRTASGVDTDSLDYTVEYDLQVIKLLAKNSKSDNETCQYRKED